MPSPLTSAQAARERVAARLKAIRLDAEIDGPELARRCGWHKSKVSRIERGLTAPSPADIRDWCSACSVGDQSPELIEASRHAESMYVSFRRMHRAGMTAAQLEIVPLFEQTRHFRAYCSNLLPGFFQTLDYATAILAMFAAFQGTPDDSLNAAEARVSRSQAIFRPRNRVAVLIEEHVLRHRFADDAVMRDQLDYLLEIMSLPNISVGVMPFGARRTIWGLEAFYVFDDRRVNVETLTAAINITSKPEIIDYTRAFAELARVAVYGVDARMLIQAARDTLG